MAVNVDETISIHCHPINCHFWSLAFFFSFFMWNLACMTGDDYFISSDESVETIELFSKSLRVNKFPWWVTCIKYYLTIFLLCSTFLPLRQSKYVRLLSGCSCYTIPCSVQKVNISIARGIWFIRSSFFSSSCADCFEQQNQWLRIPCAHTCMIILRLALPKNTMTMEQTWKK